MKKKIKNKINNMLFSIAYDPINTVVLPAMFIAGMVLVYIHFYSI